MQILIDSDNSNCDNLGDLAMLQVMLHRLCIMWPQANLKVLTRVPETLLKHCPEATPLHELSRYSWLADDYLLGAVHNRLPPRRSHQLGVLKRQIERTQPFLVESAICLKARLRNPQGDPRPFLDTLKNADWLLVSGTGGFTDSAKSWTYLVLETLDMAIRRGIPTALFGQGIGPMDDPQLRARVSAVLPHVNLIAIREQVTARPLLEALGVPSERIVTTGDDAIELAYNAHPSTLSNGVGINLRVAAYAEIGLTMIEKLRPILHEFARTHQAPLIPIPIALHVGVDDPCHIQSLLMGYENSVTDGLTITRPTQAIELAGRCRIVVTGAYHAAVFALSQGIPTICLAQSQYYVDKFVGLRDQFGEGCEMILLSDADWAQSLRTAMENAWTHADQIRPILLDAALRQIELGQAAYQQLNTLSPSSRSTHSF